MCFGLIRCRFSRPRTVVFTILLLGAAVRGQNQPPALRVDLDQAIQLALAHNHALASFQETVNISEARYKAGVISEGDLLKIKLQMLQFETDVSSAELNLVQARTSLRGLLGYDAAPESYDVVGDLAYAPLHGN